LIFEAECYKKCQANQYDRDESNKIDNPRKKAFFICGHVPLLFYKVLHFIRYYSCGQVKSKKLQITNYKLQIEKLLTTNEKLQITNYKSWKEQKQEITNYKSWKEYI